MFDNIGSKIKLLAKIIFLIELLVFLAIGLILIINNFFIAGWLCVIVGPIISWISSFFTYGFGKLISNTDIIAKGIVKQEKPASKNDKEDKI